MSSFANKFNDYTMTQLNEILEDDEKLTKMIQEMDEVCEDFRFCSQSLATDQFSRSLFFSPAFCCAFLT